MEGWDAGQTDEVQSDLPVLRQRVFAGDPRQVSGAVLGPGMFKVSQRPDRGGEALMADGYKNRCQEATNLVRELHGYLASSIELIDDIEDDEDAAHGCLLRASKFLANGDIDRQLDDASTQAMNMIRYWCWAFQCDTDDDGHRCAVVLKYSKEFLANGSMSRDPKGE